MASRMDRYYNSNSESRRRSRRNESLYDTIYNDDIEYSNVEGIARIEKTNEIDINRIREMLKEEEEKKKKKVFQPILKSEIDTSDMLNLDDREDRNYDIRDILNKAKEEKVDEEKDQYRNLQNTQYNILKKLKLDKDYDPKEKDSFSEQIKSLSNTDINILNEITDRDLSLELLGDLKSDTKTLNQNSIKKILEEAKEQQKDEKNSLDDSRELDKSFFTSSLNFSDEDFEELKELGSTYRRKSILIKSLIFIVIMALIIMVALYFIKIS